MQDSSLDRERSSGRRRFAPAPAVAAAALLLALSGCSSSTGSSASTDPSAAAAASASPSPAPVHKPEITGQITAIKGTAWTLKATDGKTYTVTTTPTTEFGTKKNPVPKEQFKVGGQTRIRGELNGLKMTASQVRLPPTKTAPSN